jgi:hypothetical protein
LASTRAKITGQCGSVPSLAISLQPSDRTASIASDEAGGDRRGDDDPDRIAAHPLAEIAGQPGALLGDVEGGVGGLPVGEDHQAASAPISPAASRAIFASACFLDLAPLFALAKAFSSTLAFSLGRARRNSIRPRSAAERYLPALGSLRQVADRAGVLRGLDQSRVDVGFAADRRRVAERLGDRLDHALQLDAAVPLDPLEHRLEGDDAGAPGAEVLGGEILAHRRLDVGVDVARADRAGIARLVHIFEQALARQVLRSARDSDEVAVGDGHRPLDAVLAGIADLQPPALDLRVPVAQGGRAEALVLLGIFLVADPHPGLVDQPHHRGEHGVGGGRLAFEVRLDLLAELGQRPPEGGEPLIFARFLPAP